MFSFFLLVCVLHIDVAQSSMEETNTLPAADGKLHLYVLPVGHGDAQVLQCPNGDIAIIDMGSREGGGFWGTTKIKTFLQGHFNKIRNVVVTLHHECHDSFFDEVFTDDLSGLSNVYISCTANGMEDTLANWIKRTGASDKLRTFNGGRSCGFSNGVPCEKVTLCPENPEVETKVLSANAYDCKNRDSGTDSIVIRVKFNDFTMLLTGDFEDAAADHSEKGAQEKMVNFYGSELQVTVYKLAQHGYDCHANKRVMLDAVKPKAVFVSSNPYYGDRPKCQITDYLRDELKCICKPTVTDSTSRFYCGEHPITNISSDGKLQQNFVCGMPKGETTCSNGKIISSTTNEYAIYSTVPSETTINLIHLLTDGTKWGFVNNFQQK